jgi:hypothetical protein
MYVMLAYRVQTERAELRILGFLFGTELGCV